MAMALVLALAGFGYAANTPDSKTLTVNEKCELTLTPTTINFPNADPDTTPSIPADSTVAVTAKVKTAKRTNPVTLTCLATGDLSSADDTIAISNVTWTATGAGFVTGTMNKTTAQSAGTWAGSGKYEGTLTYALANSWDYPSGSFTATVTYTFTAP